MLKIGLLQMPTTPLKVEENLSLAGHLILLATQEGAQLVVLPEMFNVGYHLGEDLMTVAETLKTGKTVSWLKSQAAQYDIYIITSLYERFEGHFYNTMVMVGCDGSLQYYRKRNPALSEVAVWRRSPVPGPGIFDTPFGRIGGAICFDSFARETFVGFKKSAVDLIVIVACWGIPRLVQWRPDLLFLRPILQSTQSLALDVMPYQYATQTGVPVVFVNQAGTSRTPLPVPSGYPWPVPLLNYDLPGNSQVRDATGKILVRADNTQTVFYAVVPTEIRPVKNRPKIRRIDIPPRYLSADYYFVQPPRQSKLTFFLATLMQACVFRDLQREYELRRARHTDNLL